MSTWIWIALCLASFFAGAVTSVTLVARANRKAIGRFFGW